MTKLPPPIWMFIFLMLSGVASYFGHVPPNLRFWPIGAVLIVIGFAIAMTAVAIFRREGTEIDPMSATNKHLVVRGPFRFTRNPMYLALVLFSTGIAMAVGTWPMFIVPVAIFAIANWGHIPVEEAKMRRQHGEAYDAYVQGVRRWV
jgi:protein-S-isoprenylcysteine O-methyltransferase Ste14